MESVYLRRISPVGCSMRLAHSLAPLLFFYFLSVDSGSEEAEHDTISDTPCHAQSARGGSASMPALC